MTAVLFSLLDAGVGGGQVVALNVASALARRGTTIGVLVPADGPAVGRFVAVGSAVHLADITSLRRPVGVAAAAKALRGYDLLYSHTSVPGEILGAATARVARRAHVVHRHVYAHFSPRPALAAAQRLLYRRALSRAAVIAVADHVGASIRDVGVPPGRITVVPNGFDLAAAEDAPGRTPDGDVRVGMLARFDPQKGIDTFVEAARLAAPQARASFVVAGPSGPFPAYERQVREDALRAGVEVLPPQPQGSGFLASLDVVVMPSRWEGHPLVLLEAMAAGRAVVATAIPGIRETLEPGDAGVLVPPDDAPALAEAIASLVADPARRAELGARARKVVATRYALDAVVGRAIEILDAAASSTSRSRG